MIKCEGTWKWNSDELIKLKLKKKLTKKKRTARNVTVHTACVIKIIIQNKFIWILQYKSRQQILHTKVCLQLFYVLHYFFHKMNLVFCHILCLCPFIAEFHSRSAMTNKICHEDKTISYIMEAGMSYHLHSEAYTVSYLSDPGSTHYNKTIIADVTNSSAQLPWVLFLIITVKMFTWV